MSIAPEEWLDAAKRIPVGTKTRINHAGESRDNLVVFNNPDSWSCWCFACNAGGKVPKSHVTLVEEVTPSKGSSVPLPDDCEPLQSAPDYLRNTAYGYLLIRGINPDTMLDGLDVLVSNKAKRLCLEMQSGAYVGRGLANQKVKAITFSDKPPFKYAHHPKDPTDLTDKHVVLTEDYLSALKVRHAMGRSVLAVSVQGSGISYDLMPRILRASKVSVMLDGDKAGREGTLKIWHKIKGLIKDVQLINTPDGKDPKNLTIKDIRRLVNGDDR